MRFIHISHSIFEKTRYYWSNEINIESLPTQLKLLPRLNLINCMKLPLKRYRSVQEITRDLILLGDENVRLDWLVKLVVLKLRR